jgi:hypothetical protein
MRDPQEFRELARKCREHARSSIARGQRAKTAKQVIDAAAKTYKQGAQAAEYLSHKTAEQPLVALLIAGAIGFSIAYMLFRRDAV